MSAPDSIEWFRFPNGNVLPFRMREFELCSDPHSAMNYLNSIAPPNTPPERVTVDDSPPDPAKPIEFTPSPGIFL